MKHLSAVLLFAMLGLAAKTHAQPQPITSGNDTDYQPSVIRSSDDGARIVVFEQLNASL